MIRRIRAKLAAGAALTALGAVLLLGAPAPVRADGVTDGNAGREAILAGNYDEAIKLFTRALTFGGLTSMNQAVALNLRGYAYLEKGQNDLALADLNESLKMADTADARFNRARILIVKFRFDDAIDDLTHAMSLGSRAADVYAYRGHAQLYAGRLPLAIKDLDEAIRLQPNYPFAFLTRGHAYLNANQEDKAIADETKAIQLDPKSLEAHWLRAYAYRYRKKQPEKALADYSAALAIDPADSTNRTGRADVYEELGRFAEAQADYDTWIRENPRGPFGYWARGRLNLIQGRPEAAAADLVKAVQFKPADAYNVLWLHLARLKAGTDDKAEFAANAAKLNTSIWPGAAVDYFLGKADAATVLTKASAGAEGKARDTQTCEAQLFLGQDDMAQGRRAQGVDRLQAAIRTCDGASREARLIKAQLKIGGPAAPRPTPVPAVIRAPSLSDPAAIVPPAPRPRPKVQQQAAKDAGGGDPLLLRGSLK